MLGDTDGKALVEGVAEDDGGFDAAGVVDEEGEGGAEEGAMLGEEEGLIEGVMLGVREGERLAEFGGQSRIWPADTPINKKIHNTTPFT